MVKAHAREPLKAHLDAVEDAVRRVFVPHLRRTGGRRFWATWRGTLRRLRPLGAVSLGNRIQVLSDGDEVFERMWRAIASAKKRIVMETYTLQPDEVGGRMLRELSEAAQRGVEVDLVFDAFGSSDLPDRRVEELRASGVRAMAYNPILRWPWSGRLSRLVRNHRKILVVDEETAFCGGMNISADYAGKRFGNGRFRDTHLLIRGPSAGDLAEITSHLLEQDQRKKSAVRTPLLAEISKGSLVQILESNIGRHRRAIQRALRWTIRGSQERCYLTSPYFVPPLLLVRIMTRAARRGVDVRVLTTGRSDVPIVHAASQHMYGRLLREGVRIYEMTERTLHAKTVTIDGVYASVGSFNLDRWSHRRNLEVTAGVLDRRMASELEEHFQEDLESSREVSLEEWNRRTLIERVGQALAYQLMRL